MQVTPQEFTLCQALNQKVTWHGVSNQTKEGVMSTTFEILSIADDFNDFVECVKHHYKFEREAVLLGYAMMFAGMLISMNVIIQEANQVRSKKS